jgi:hypothetical protein
MGGVDRRRGTGEKTKREREREEKGKLEPKRKGGVDEMGVVPCRSGSA